MIVLILVSRLDVDTKDIVILSVGGSITIVWFLVGYFSFPRESNMFAGLFFLFSPAEIGYVIYKLIDVSLHIYLVFFSCYAIKCIGMIFKKILTKLYWE